MDSEALPVLVVEDSEDDVFLLQRAFRNANLKNPIHFATDGEEALDYLSSIGTVSDHARHQLPFLVFLDLKLPFKGGLEILEWIQEQSFRDDLRVVILTSSGEERDIVKAYQLGASAYLVKPATAASLQQLITRASESLRTRQSMRPSHLSEDMFNQRRFVTLQGES